MYLVVWQVDMVGGRGGRAGTRAGAGASLRKVLHLLLLLYLFDTDLALDRGRGSDHAEIDRVPFVQEVELVQRILNTKE